MPCALGFVAGVKKFFLGVFSEDDRRASLSNSLVTKPGSEETLLMYIIEEEAKVLASKLVPYLTTMLSGSFDSDGDLAKTEDAIGSALDRVRSAMVNAALDATIESAPGKWACPGCKKRLVAWKERIRTIVTRHGEGRLRVMRYRCRSCRKDYYPFQVLNDLCGTHFTIGARALIAREAAEDAFGKASSRLAQLGVPVSASEVEQIADEVGRMRKEEEEIVRIHLHTSNQDLPLPLYQWQEWKAPAKSAAHAVVSVDGAKVRSDELGPDGLKWFEVRSGVLTLPGENMPKAQIAGDITPDALFESMRAIWRQSAVRDLLLVFVADGAEWIWDRVKLFFPRALQILDIYHAGEHVASAARAAWGENSSLAAEWKSHAILMLIETGVRSIIRQLCQALRAGNLADRDELIKNIRYLWRHRNRMHYAKCRQAGLDIGSGTMESRIKQACSTRLRKPGMMWGKPGADNMLRLRAAVLSQSLALTTQRHRQICFNRVNEYRLAA